MGIKDLNKFIRSNCSKEAIKKVNLDQLYGKKIAVDISIYLYKYAIDDCLIENMYTLFALFRKHNIIPIFVFEGKSPAEKKALLQQRKEEKIEAEKEYNSLKSMLSSYNNEIEDSEKQEILENMDILKKKFVYINRDQINSVKQLITLFGMTYYDAPGEADELCASLVIKKKVWACMSEDMDMFVYGCPIVLRYFSLLNHDVVVYTHKLILEELGLTQEEFRQICILSGTDYNINFKNNKCNLTNSLKLFKKYKKDIKKNDKYLDNPISFYEWIMDTNNYIEDYNILMNIYEIFDLSRENYKIIEMFENIKIMNSSVDIDGMKPMLMKYGFIF
jgi:5'-3' exonuclease